MKPKDLLFKLSDLESVLASYSFEELKVAEATQLKKSFEHFKYSVQEKISVQGTPTKNVNGTIPQTALASQLDRVADSVDILLKDTLNKFIGILDFLKDEVTTPQQLSQVVEIQQASSALLGSVDALLACNSHKINLHPSEEIDFNLYELINNAKFLSENLIVRDNLNIVVRCIDVLPGSVVGDTTKVMHIVLHLLTNAIQFAGSGEIYLQVSSKTTFDNTTLHEFQIDNLSCELIQTNSGILEANTNDHHYANEIIKLMITNLGGSVDIFKHSSSGSIFNFRIPFKKGRKAV